MEIFVGKFTEQQLIDKEDKTAIEETKAQTGLKFIKNKIEIEGGVKYMKVWLSNKF